MSEIPRVQVSLLQPALRKLTWRSFLAQTWSCCTQILGAATDSWFTQWREREEVAFQGYLTHKKPPPPLGPYSRLGRLQIQERQRPSSNPKGLSGTSRQSAVRILDTLS